MNLSALGLSAILTLLIAIPVLATDGVFVAVPAIREAFSTDSGSIQIAMTSYILSYAIVQLVYGPLSDRFGRRKVLLVSLVLFTLGSALCAAANSLGWLIAARALQGIGAGSGPTLARAILRDRHGAKQSIRLLSYIMAAFGVIAVIVPMVGGILVENIGWPAVFILGSLYGVVCIALVWFGLEETRPAESAVKRGISRNFQSYAILLKSRNFMMLAGANSAIYGAMFAWIAGAMFVLIEGLGQAAGAAGTYYAVSIVGFVLGSALAGRLQLDLTPLQVIAGGIIICLAASITGWSISDVRTPLAVIVPGFVVMIGIGFVVAPATALGIGPYPEMAGAASALIGFIQMAVSSLTVLAVGYIFDGTAGPMMILMAVLCFISLGLFFPFLDRLRDRLISR